MNKIKQKFIDEISGNRISEGKGPGGVGETEGGQLYGDG